jgi:dephospho-CoA kinase
LENPSKPFVIGLIGNLGAGKSMVRRMLERLGGLGIDADIISHRVILKTHPVYQKVLDLFGTGILNEKGEINRKKLASCVFANPDQLQQLERLVHPAVETVCRNIIATTPAPFVIIEAIKLLESSLVNDCNSIWAVDVPLDTQIERVMRSRGMTRTQALQRIQHQSQADIKAQSAQVIIDNGVNPEATWKQVTAALNSLQSTNVEFSRAVALFEEWKSQHRTIRFLQPTNSILTRKLISAAQPLDWINSWISSAIHQYSEKIELVTRSNYFEMLVNFQGILHQPERNPELLSILKMDNFILQPLYLFRLNLQKPFNLPLWLQSLQYLADQFSCEAILLPIPKKAEFMNQQLQTSGYQLLPAEDSLYDLWKSETARTRLTGYNILAKSLRSHFQVP